MVIVMILFAQPSNQLIDLYLYWLKKLRLIINCKQATMKKYFLSAVSLLIMTNVLMAQDGGNGDKGFKKENLFAGGSVTVSFFNGQTVLGADPMFGYKLANWVDAG